MNTATIFFQEIIFILMLVEYLMDPLRYSDTSLLSFPRSFLCNEEFFNGFRSVPFSFESLLRRISFVYIFHFVNLKSF